METKAADKEKIQRYHQRLKAKKIAKKYQKITRLESIDQHQKVLLMVIIRKSKSVITKENRRKKKILKYLTKQKDRKRRRERQEI